MANAMISQKEISTLIPHGPGMSLIDEIVEWDQQFLAARTMSHTAPDNPLRGSEDLHSVHSIEYAAQCMAVHAALNEEVGVGRPMVVGALKNVHLSDVRLSAMSSALIIQVQLVMSGNTGAIYDFSVQHLDTIVASGRITLLVNPAGVDNELPDH